MEPRKLSVNKDDSDKNELSFKIIVIGDPGVGKSCLTGRATKDVFNAEYSTTIGFEFLTFNVKIEDKSIKLQIWDTCGQEQYKSLINNFYRNSALAMLVYSIDNKQSFLDLNKWFKEIRIQSSPDIKLILIGNKADLENKREVTYEEGKKFMEENEIIFFEEASAKSGINAKEIFNEAAKILYNEYMNFVRKARNARVSKFSESSLDTSKLKSFIAAEKQKKKCCS